ncbi:hypothetical protein [Stieleria varia]|uniref:Uncharacterized protein n=1 Tax=Stieleria varia TaxID=2528005 RepID=A0A5C6AF05_9BACT|nr:hypothetical protein [Stieleria varia]TWT98602.1 hypothetical protein Pla52n_51190 [Stieleria varia]
MKRRKRSSLENGNDAFLDIVANLVGILIILVVILGAKSQQVIRETQEQKLNEEPKITYAGDAEFSDLATEATRAAAARADSLRLEKTIKVLDQQLASKAEQRATMLDVLRVAEEAWKEHQESLDEVARERSKQNEEMALLHQELETVDGELQRLANQDTPVIAVSHLPTPMAKTVFGTEIHMRLKDNRLSVVPVDRLLDELKRDLSRVAGGSRDGMMDAVIGPVNDYVARYALHKSEELVARGGAVGRMTMVQLQAIMFEPLNEPHGLMMDEVLRDRQWLDIQLAGRNPATTTVTVWVYPDSYAAFRSLKENLYERGFATAGRPLEAHRPIMASPHGTRSSAQ